MNTISPAIGNYDILTVIKIDTNTVETGSMTGAFTGIPGDGTLLPYDYDSGITGIQGTNFTNLKHGF